ncbi:MAG: flavin reductase family protein [Methylicorpusculum sp.]|uniref:flavin reductase family protein n=1 Tax=Methylicorpusculum sp. TaxID=2713644 RepID=UPI002728D2D4|nr:flavin reductase family protein [Methylicorpusculum sp.]MDO8844463.1 flavin reductase family protein [Methylicorpusculum sp.]MDO8940542.1 flavin reductase family protein [Methylicorpusculum sp.]MDO9239939.1 flavin reductase family protein [Methylicorpusculum sp.]MDP2179072.1 flavin reductase family protein [Methylicorpusculum sp.]MDP2204452.1 flavin reductase family protein [Methylicorpusculum sp.]
MTVEASEFKNALQLWASGVTVVTTQSDRFGLQGMTATSFSSVSLDPPQVLVCINERADTGEGIEESQHFAVNILTTGQEQVSNEFAGKASQEDRFRNVSWSQGKEGMPLLDDSLASLECRVLQKVKAGTHWIIVGEVNNVICREGDPLLYYSTAYRTLTA